MLQVERDKLPKLSSHHSSIESLIKVPDPQLLPFFKSLDYVEVLAQIHEELQSCPPHKKSRLYLFQFHVFKGLGEVKFMHTSLRAAWKKSTSVHEKLIFGAWLKYEKHKDGLKITDLLDSCHKCKQEFGFTDIISEFTAPEVIPTRDSNLNTSSKVVVFRIGSESIACDRIKIANLSHPFYAMLYGSFSESFHACIDFSLNGVSADGMKVVCEFSISNKLRYDICPNILLELLIFANRFCCETLKYACERRVASLISSIDDAVELMEFANDQNSPILSFSCLQILLHEIPECLNDDHVVDLLINCGKSEGSFPLYCLLSEVIMKLDSQSDKTAMILQKLVDSAEANWERQLAFHQIGCVRLLRKEYDEAKKNFETALLEGHTYSLLGLTRVRSAMGESSCSSYENLTPMIITNPVGWIYQERSLYCDGDKKLEDLEKATEFDPTLTYPYMYRAALLVRKGAIASGVAEIDRVLRFKVALELLELRFCFHLVLECYENALCDIQAILTLSPDHRAFEGRVAATQLCTLVREHVVETTVADCWMELYDRWCSVDDIGSLSVIYQMLQSDAPKGVLYFRQSLLLLRLNCAEAAMRSLGLAREHASSEHERLVYEGWILYDTGHHVEGLHKAEESINIKRSFEAFFLKAYALADCSADQSSSSTVVLLLEEALSCHSDRLRKGQALNNLGSVYVDCGKYDLAADCYTNALQLQHARAHQGLARVHFLNNDKNAAFEEMSKLISKAQNNASAYEKRSEYSEQEQTIADLEMVTRLDPLRVYPYRYRAAVLMDENKEKEAIEELSRAIRFKPDVQLLHLRASFCSHIHDVSGTVRDCRAALSILPNHREMREFHKIFKEMGLDLMG